MPPHPAPTDESLGSLLVVHRDARTLDYMVSALTSLYSVAFSTSSAEAGMLLRHGLQPNVILVTPALGGMGPGSFVGEARLSVPDAVIVYLVEEAEMAPWAARTLAVGSCILMGFHWQRSEILQTIRIAIQHSRLRARVRQLEETLARERVVLEKVTGEADLVRANLIREGQERAQAEFDLIAVLGRFVGEQERMPSYHTPHGLHTAYIAREIAAGLSLEADRIADLVVAALLHDLGKASLPAFAVLPDPASLPVMDRSFYETHVEETVKILSKGGLSPRVVEIVRQHHELGDGSGFPSRLFAAEISIEAQILAVADVYHNGVYRVVEGAAPQDDAARQRRAEETLQWFRPREHLYAAPVVQGLFSAADHLEGEGYRRFAVEVKALEWRHLLSVAAASEGMPTPSA